MKYDFVCDICGAKVEVTIPLFNIHGVTLTCANCGTKMRRVFEPTSVHFRGPDFACNGPSEHKRGG